MGCAMADWFFKKDETTGTSKNACCAAQMFLDSGDGVVFKGALGPWYNEDTGDFHLSHEAAKALGELAIKKVSGNKTPIFETPKGWTKDDIVRREAHAGHRKGHQMNRPVDCVWCAREFDPAVAFASFGDHETGEQLWSCSEDCAVEDGIRHGEIEE